MGDSCFVGPLIRHFASSGDIFAVRSVGTRNQSMILLRPDSFGVVSSFRPSQTEVCPVLIRSLEELQSLFEVLPLSTLALQLHCQDPDYCVFPDKSSSVVFEVDQHATTVCIDLQGKFEEYWCERPTKLRQSIDGSLRKLNRNGIDWMFTTVESPQEIQRAVNEYGDLETRGWKHHVGTAVHSTNIQGQFYRDVLEGFAERGKGIVYELYFDGSLVSSQLAIANESMVITLKTTYDETYSKYSPGKLLDYLTLRHEFEQGRFSKVEFCTNAGPELIRWGTRSRPISHITIFRNKSSWRLARAYRRIKSIKALLHSWTYRAQGQVRTREKRV
jgi:CelD/BcsL family acetyltransferase involved in cellulose biosynthesis